MQFLPEASALLILDMQNYFLDEGSHAFVPSAIPIITRIRRLADLYSDRGLPVISTRHLNSETDAGMMGTWWQDLIFEKDVRSEIVTELNMPCAHIIRKSQYDAFYKTDLEKLMHLKNVRQVVVTGVMTHLCCETTARSAFIRGFEVFFPVDGTATINQDFHWSTLLNLSHGFARIVLAEKLVRRFGRADG
jgi:isochorismate hydrolase